MKKFLTLFAFFLFFSYSSVFADNPTNCTVDLVTEGIKGAITNTTNWREIMHVKGSDSFLWQRGIITSQSEGIQLQEGKPVKIYGVAEPYANIQVLIFPQTDNNSSDDIDGIKPPIGAINGSCFTVDPANATGLFSFQINIPTLWENLGKTQVIDVFYQTDITWQQFLDRRTDLQQNIYVGSHVEPRRAMIKGSGTSPSGCPSLCDTGLVESVVLNPSRFAPPALLGDNFEDLSGNEVVIGRFPGDHTYYAKTSGAGDILALRWTTQKAIAMEIIKRRLLGNKNVGGVSPGISDIKIDNLMNAFNNTGESSAPTKEFVLHLYSLLVVPKENTDPPPPGDDPPPPGDVPPPPGIPTREEAIEYMNPILNRATGDDRNDDLLTVLFPNAVSTNENWAGDLLRLMNFWTGKVDVNECLLSDDDKTGDNFLRNGIEWGNLTQCSGSYSYVTGSTPTILLNTKEALWLSPDFTNIRMISSQEWFSDQEIWQLAEGEKNPLSYKYEMTTPFTGDFLSESCIQKEHISEYARHIADHIKLSSAEEKVIISELEQILKYEKSFVRLRIADPKTLSPYFSWKGNGKTLDILELFFDVQEKTCGSKDLGNIPLVASPFRDGIEVGILP